MHAQKWLPWRRAAQTHDGQDVEAQHGPHAAPSISLIAQLTQGESCLLNELKGDADAINTSAAPSASAAQAEYLKYVRQKAETLPFSDFTNLLNLPDDKTKSPDGLYTILGTIAKCMRAEAGHFSIQKAMEALQSNQLLKPAPECDEDRATQARRLMHLIFHCIAWLLMLYSAKPGREPLTDYFQLDERQSACIVASQTMDNSSSPICEFVQEYGPLLPFRETGEPVPSADPIFHSESLYVSLLNAKTLVQIGGITIEWIDNFSSHLTFDPETLRLRLFCLPSFCDLNRFENSTLAQILSSYYDEFSKPAHFTTAAVLKEIRLSYRLLFADDSRSRALYSSEQRKRARLGASDDNLDSLCLHRLDSRITRNSYSKSKDFPILAPRLSVLQDHIQRQNPRSVVMLWRDRRNLLQWSTFWAVVIVGGIGIICAIVQVALAGAQVALSSD